MSKWKYIQIISYIIILLTLLFIPAVQAAEDDYLVSGFGDFSEDGVIERVNGHDITTQRNGKIIAAAFIGFNGEGTTIEVTRYNVDGSIDTSFGNNGRQHVSFTTDFALVDIAVQSDDRIIIGGSSREESKRGGFVIFRLLPDGTLDTSFAESTTDPDGDGESTYPDLADIVVQKDDKIIAFGTNMDCGIFACVAQQFGVSRYLADGGRDPSFDDDGHTNISFGFLGDEDADNVVIQEDGKIVLFGTHTDGVDGDHEIAIARLHPNGTRDFSFNNDGQMTKGVEDLVDGPFDRVHGAVLTDGTMIVAGSNNKIARFKEDGDFDQEFGNDGVLLANTPFGLSTPYITSMQPNGNFLVAGSPAGNVSGEPFTILASYTPDGQLDPNFGTAGAVKLPVVKYSMPRDFHMANDGRIYVLSDSSVIDEKHTLFPLAAQTASVIPGGWVTQDISAGFDMVKDVAVQSNGEIAVVGDWDDDGHVVARYEANGRLDKTLSGQGYFLQAGNRAFGYAIAVDNQQRMWVVSGRESSADNLDFVIRRYTPIGVLVPFEELGQQEIVTDWGGELDRPAVLKTVTRRWVYCWWGFRQPNCGYQISSKWCGGFHGRFAKQQWLSG